MRPRDCIFSFAMIPRISCVQSKQHSIEPNTPSTQPVAMRQIEFQKEDREFYNGDDIRITSVKCTADKMAKGETIEVRGAYDLETCGAATLALSVTPPTATARGRGGNIRR